MKKQVEYANRNVAKKNESNFKKRDTISVRVVNRDDKAKPLVRKFISISTAELKNENAKYEGTAYVLDVNLFHATYVARRLHNRLASNEAREYKLDMDLETFVSEYAKIANGFLPFKDELTYVMVKGSATAKPGQRFYNLYLGGEYAVKPEYNDVYINLREAQQLVEAYDCKIKVSRYLMVKGEHLKGRHATMLRNLLEKRDKQTKLNFYQSLRGEIKSKNTPLAALSFDAGLCYCTVRIAADIDKKCSLITIRQTDEFLVKNKPVAEGNRKFKAKQNLPDHIHKIETFDAFKLKLKAIEEVQYCGLE